MLHPSPLPACPPQHVEGGHASPLTPACLPAYPQLHPGPAPKKTPSSWTRGSRRGTRRPRRRRRARPGRSLTSARQLGRTRSCQPGRLLFVVSDVACRWMMLPLKRCTL